MGGALAAILGAVLLGLAFSLLNPSRPGTGRLDSTPSPSVLPQPSGSVAATTKAPTPAPTAKPTPGLPGTVTFGTALNRATRQITAPGTTFTPGSIFAHSIALNRPFGVTQIYEQVVRVENGGKQTTVQAPSEALNVQAAWTVTGYATRADALLQAWGPGTYRMMVYLSPNGRDMIATGTFTLAAG
jgi:hypothetical protein